LQTLVTS